MNDPEIRDYLITHDLATVATLAKASLDDCHETIRNKIKPAVQVAARCLETWTLDEVNSAVANVVKQMAHGSAAPWKQARGGGRSVGGGAARAGEPAAAAADAEEQNVNFDHDGGDPDEQLRHCEQLERARLRWQLVSRERNEGKQYGVPYTYYQWGVYYRKDLMEQYGLSEPTTWAEEKANCQTYLDNGIKCYTIGTKFLWTAGGWFDYLNMRTNGYDYHAALTGGTEKWDSEATRATFANWRELIDMGAFIDNHQTYSWQEAMPFMVNGEAASYLMGNFSVASFREGGLDDSKLDFYQFPEITAGIAKGEDAPTDTFHIPSGATNKENARAFLKFVVSADNQTLINNGENLGQLPVNSLSSVDDDKFLNEGFAMLSNDAPGGVAQFFDRDAPAEMAAVAMEGFQEFMLFPDNLDDILARLDEAAVDIYAE